MTNNKKRVNKNNGSQKGNTYDEGMASANIMSKEELEKGIHPTGRQNTKQ